MDGGKDWLEAIIMRKAYEDSPIKVLDMETVDSRIGKGENFLSQIGRVKAKVILGSGKSKTMSFVLKNEHETEKMKKFSQESGVFFKETTMYRDILPKMENLLEEIGDPDGAFWPRCYDIRLYDRLMFEDLAAMGYRMADRKKQLSLDAGLLVMRHLAKFHALSRVLLSRGEIPEGLVARTRVIGNREESLKFTNKRVKNAIAAMETWGDDWKEAVERFKKAENLGERAVDAYTIGPDEFTVLNHGDCWTNNLLFSGEDLDHPNSVRILDLQIAFVGSPVRDIIYFLSSSVRPEVVDNNFDLFLKTYADAIGSFLTKFDYEGPVPDFESIKEEFKKREIWMVGDAIGVIPWMLTDVDNVPDIEEALRKREEDLRKQTEKGEQGETDTTSVAANILLHLDPVAKKIIQHLIKRVLRLNIV